MTTWGVVILGSALVVGTRAERRGLRQYAFVVAISIVAVLYAGLRQHTL